MFDHLSASHVNDFIERRSKWFLTRIHGARLSVGSKAWRGTACEIGAIMLARGNDRDATLEAAFASFDYEAQAGESDDGIRSTIPAIVDALAGELMKMQEVHGPITTHQRKIECTLPGIQWPFIGFTDVEFTDGHITDIKVPGRTPSSLSGGWGRQGAIYNHATGKAVSFLAAVPLSREVKTVTFDLGNQAPIYLNQVRDAALNIQRLIALPKEMLAAACAPDPDDWMMKDPETRRAAAEVWPYMDEAV